MTRKSHRALKTSAAVLAISVLVFLPGGALARLAVKDLQKGKAINKLECTDLCTVDLKYQIVSTGFDTSGHADPATYTVTSIEELVIFESGDKKNDILTTGSATQDCIREIVAGAPCTVTASFKVVDNDPNDDNQSDTAAGVPDAVWRTILDISYKTSADTDGHSFQPEHDVGILDDSPKAAEPEPASWAMMLLGFAAVGAGLRRRRPRAAA